MSSTKDIVVSAHFFSFIIYHYPYICISVIIVRYLHLHYCIIKEHVTDLCKLLLGMQFGGIDSTRQSMLSYVRLWVREKFAQNLFKICKSRISRENIFLTY